MTFNYNVTGAKRKELVNAISEITEAPSNYRGAPTFAYEVDCFTIDKNGGVTFDDSADSEEIEMLVERLLEKGFEPEPRLEEETRRLRTCACWSQAKQRSSRRHLAHKPCRSKRPTPR